MNTNGHNKFITIIFQFHVVMIMKYIMRIATPCHNLQERISIDYTYYIVGIYNQWYCVLRP